MKSRARWLVVIGSLLVVGSWLAGWEFTHASAWREGGVGGAPSQRLLNLQTTTLEVGQGRAVQGGDLVRVGVRELPDIAPGTLDMFPQSREEPSSGEAWLWVGDLRAERTTFGATTRSTTPTPRPHPNYDLGPPDLRAALLGTRIGSRVEMKIGLPPERTQRMFVSGDFGSLPANGYVFAFDWRNHLVDPLKSSRPIIPVTYGHSYEVTVRKACPARVLVQDVTIRHFGPRFVSSPGCWLCLSPSFYRHAKMQFAVVDVSCERGERAGLGLLAVVDTEATAHPEEFEESIKARIHNLKQQWPEGFDTEEPRQQMRGQETPQPETAIERKVREHEERANFERE